MGNHVAYEEPRKPLTRLFPLIPQSNREQPCRNESRFAKSEQKSRHHECRNAFLKSLKSCYQAPNKNLTTDPDRGPYTIQDEIAGYFQENNAERKELLAHVELTLSNADIAKEEVCKGVSCFVSIFKLIHLSIQHDRFPPKA